jgi:transcriptional regulator with XRE-family HTH domain
MEGAMELTLGKLVSRLRKKTGLSQKKFAQRCMLGESTIRQLERDEKNKDAPTSIRPTTLDLIADGAGLDKNHSDRLLLHELAWERERQKRIVAVAPLLAPIAGKKFAGDFPLNSSYDLSQHQVLTSMEDVAECAISMLTQASNEQIDKIRADEILVTTQGASSIFLYLGQEDRWDQAIRSVMQDRKWNVVSLYRMIGDQKRAIEVIQEIRNLSIYPAQFIPRYFRRIGEVRPAYNLLIIPRIGALLCLSTHDPAVIDAAFFYPDTMEFAQHIRLLTDHFNLMFTETDQLARTYERSSPEWDDTMTRICQLEADEFLANNRIDANSMPPASYDDYLEKALKREKSYSPMEFRRMKTHYIQRREAFERNVQSYTYRTIMPWRYFEEALGVSKDENAAGECRYLVSYATGPDRYITVDKIQAIAHMKHLIQDLRRYDNYEIALVEDPPTVEDLLYTPWLVKGEVAVLTAIYTKSEDGQHPVFAAEFELTETSLVRRYRQQFLTRWGEVADSDKVRQKENVIGKLTQIVEQAGGKL